jgi:hypothetical protein
MIFDVSTFEGAWKTLFRKYNPRIYIALEVLAWPDGCHGDQQQPWNFENVIHSLLTAGLSITQHRRRSSIGSRLTLKIGLHVYTGQIPF